MPLHLCSKFSTNSVNKIKGTSLNMDMKVLDKNTNNTEKMIMYYAQVGFILERLTLKNQSAQCGTFIRIMTKGT